MDNVPLKCWVAICNFCEELSGERKTYDEAIAEARAHKRENPVHMANVKVVV